MGWNDREHFIIQEVECISNWHISILSSIQPWLDKKEVWRLFQNI